MAVGVLATCVTMGAHLNRRITAFAIVRDVASLWGVHTDQAIGQFWGDSLTAGTGATPSHDIPTLIAFLFHRTMINAGLPGATSAQIAARVLARPTSTATERVVVWAGRNDDLTDPAATLHNIAAMIASLRDGSRFLVVGVLNADTVRERRGGDRYDLIVNLNERLRVLYGRRFTPLRDILIAKAIPNDGNDRDAQDADVVPPSLRFDPLRLIDRGDAISAYAIEAALEADETATGR